MENFNAKIGRKEVGNLLKIDNIVLGAKNVRGQLLLEFLCREKMFCGNTFFRKPDQRKWTWRSPDGANKNEIHYILIDKRWACEDVSVLSRLTWGEVIDR